MELGAGRRWASGLDMILCANNHYGRRRRDKRHPEINDPEITFIYIFYLNILTTKTNTL